MTTSEQTHYALAPNSWATLVNAMASPATANLGRIVGLLHKLANDNNDRSLKVALRRNRPRRIYIYFGRPIVVAAALHELDISLPKICAALRGLLGGYWRVPPDSVENLVELALAEGVLGDRNRSWWNLLAKQPVPHGALS